jgi:hypothetical protein
MILKELVENGDIRKWRDSDYLTEYQYRCFTIQARMVEKDGKIHYDVPRLNITMTANGAYTAVNHKVTTVNGPYFTRLASTVLRPFIDVSYTIKNDEKRTEN